MSLPRLLLALAVAAATLFTPAAHAVDLPRQMTFQGRLMRADGSPETAPQDLRFDLYTTATGGSPLWEESHPATPLNNGYYAVVLGATVPLPAAAVLNGQALFLGVSIVGQSELTPRLNVASVPYALRADDSNRLEGRAAASFADTAHGHPNATSTTDGFMSAADKVKLSNAPTNYGNGLNLGSGTLSVSFPASGGTNGTSSSAARSNHTHALTCTYRTATGNPSATAWCSAGDTLTGGGCTDLGAATAGAGPTFGPTNVTLVDGSASTTGPAYTCRTPTAVPTTAYAICCRNVP